MGQKLKEKLCSLVIFLGANVLEPVANCPFATVNFEPWLGFRNNHLNIGVLWQNNKFCWLIVFFLTCFQSFKSIFFIVLTFYCTHILFNHLNTTTKTDALLTVGKHEIPFPFLRCCLCNFVQQSSRPLSSRIRSLQFPFQRSVVYRNVP